MKRVAVTGYYGMGNFGDDIFREVVTDLGQSMWPGARVRAFPDGKGDTAYASHSAYSSHTFSGALLRATTTLSAITWANTAAMCGGSLFSSVKGSKRILAHAGHVRALEALGVSIGPFDTETDRTDVLRLLSGFSRLIVRDTPSLLAVRDVDAVTPSLGGDLAALYPYPPRRRADPGHIGIMPCATGNSGSSAWFDGAAAALEEIGSRQKLTRVTVYSLNNHPVVGDASIASDLVAFLGRRGHEVRLEAYGQHTLAQVIDSISRLDAVFAERLHGAIVAYLCSVPFSVLTYHRKCLDFASEIGLPTSLVIQDHRNSEEWRAAAALLSLGFDKSAPDYPASDYVRRANEVYLLS